MAGKVLVVDDDASVQRLLQYTLKQEGYEVLVTAAGAEGLALWQKESPSLILLDATPVGVDGFEVATRIRAEEGPGRHVPIIMLTSDRDVQQKVRALRAGADDYLIKPFHPAELLARMKSLIARFTPSETLMGRPPMGRVHAYYGAKGGVGTTTIAINAAIALQGLGRRVCLVDGNLQFGDHRVFLDLGNDRKSVTDLMNAPQIDAELLKSVLVRHDSGIDLLLAPTSPEEADLVTPELFAGVLAMLRSMFDYVIVDVDKRLGDLALSILDHADEVHIVMTADLSCLKNVRLVLEALRRIGFDPKRLKLALNRSNAFTGISVGAAESALKRDFETKITNEYRVAISAQNTGSPFAYSKPDSPLSKEIVELAHAIDASFAPQVPAAAGAAVPRLGAGRAR